MKRNSKVSAIIPTHNRPQLILRAVASALAQTYQDLEVVVVLDGPDLATSEALATIHDDRLRVMILPKSQGAQNARNAGIEAAQGDWIALLDDDDEWLPEKIELQMTPAINSTFRFPIVGSQFFASSPSYQLIWPRKRPYEPLSEYLLARDSCSMGEGVLITTTLLFPKDLFRLVRLAPDLQRCHDVDWLLRASGQEGSGIEFIPQPLAIVYQSEASPGITSVPNWQTSLEWVESVRGIITGRAYASYLSITVASQAARQGDWGAFSVLLRRVLTRGKPKSRDLAFLLAAFCVPRKIQLAVRRAGW
jgi:glycosyltransferase involved in cell wall biosynthesis